MSQQSISLLGKIDVSQIEGLENIMDIIQNSLDLSEIEQEITDNELVVSYALNDLNDRIESLNDSHAELETTVGDIEAVLDAILGNGA